MSWVLQLQQTLHEEIGMSATNVDPAAVRRHHLSVQHRQNVSCLVATVQDDPIS